VKQPSSPSLPAASGTGAGAGSKRRRRTALLRLERHPQGPRVHLLGRRVHEYELGIALLLMAAAWSLLALRVGQASWILAASGLYLVVKDARDLLPSTRDTGSWGLGMHRRFAPLRGIRHADGLPSLTAAVAFAVGGVNLVSALTPNVAWRGELLLAFMPVRAVPLLHTLAVPASVALVSAAFYLRRRRRRALHAAVALLVSLGVLNVVKGLDVEEAALSFAAAAVLWWGRGAFTVAPSREFSRRLLALGTALLGVTVVGSSYLVWQASGRTSSPDHALRSSLSLLAWTQPSTTFSDELSAMPWLVGGVSVALILVLAYALFRPPLPPRSLPQEEERQAAFALVRAHGSDTLAYFKLRRDTQYLFTSDGRGFLGYRIEGKVLLVAGDPIGPASALPVLVRDALAHARLHGLRVAVLGASSALLPLWRDGGLRALYLGDEAIVETAGFSLEGRAIRKVRQAVMRLEKSGYRVEVRPLATLDEATLGELEHVSTLWRCGKPERGFSMAMDALRPQPGCESVVAIARDERDRVRGFLQLVPSYGRPAMSLSLMRRDRETPNGLTEFLVVRTIEMLRERGVQELSLNFAAFGRLLQHKGGRVERLLGRLVAISSRYFQIESLYRFNAKFSPRWEPRYFVYEGLFSLPRAGVAALVAEGQLPRLPFDRSAVESRAAVAASRSG
jgi:lysyl-tRNA synthetase class 2